VSRNLSTDDWNTHWRDYNAAAERNPAQHFRHRLVDRLLQAPASGVRVLDIGSGQGDLAQLLAERHPASSIVGLEVSATGVEISSMKVPSATFMQRDLCEPGDPPAEYQRWATHATCSEVLEHVDDPGLLLRNALAYCTPGCRLVVTVPGGPMSAFDKHIGHRRHYTPAALRELLESAGLRVENVATAGFPMFNLYRLVVVSRGKRLVDDIASGQGQAVSLPARVAMGVFRGLLSIDLRLPWLGWQIAGVARVPQ
jgi:trans-aconitate methyltransferase